MNEIDIKTVRHIHFVGIKGVAMTALAIYCKQRGMRVSGSDISEEFPTDEMLARSKISVQQSFDPIHIHAHPKPDLVVYTGAHGGQENSEVIEAIRLDVPVLVHGKALGLYMQDKRQLSVAGSHGKTTTSAMIATIMMQAGFEPSYAIGCGEIFGLGFPGHFGTGDWFVAEADEYIADKDHDLTPRFLWQHPDILVVTNIDFDHPDAYGSLGDVERAFVELQNVQQGHRIAVINNDDQPSRVLQRQNHHVITYGLSPKSDIQVIHIGHNSERMFFTLAQQHMTIGEFSLKVPGLHNVYNATAAAIACHSAGVSWDQIRKGLASFGGTKRRFELLGSIDGMMIYDDYAHHPVEIAATLSSVKLWYPDKQCIVVFQSHTYSRTKALLSEFATSFTSADSVLITDIYASAREQDTGEVNGPIFSDAVAKHHPRTFYAKGEEEVYEFLKQHISKDTVVFFMGAGDIYHWGKEIYKKLSKE